MELTILMPCLNEAETLKTCIEKANAFLYKHKIDGEVLIADNGSTDGSQKIAVSCGARVVDIPERGYGAALIGGNEAALGKYIIMGDADDSYDFSNLMPFVERLRAGDELVMGNRFKGEIKKGAMPPLHKYLGNPVLSFIGRLFYPSSIGDFHCGLRGYHAEKLRGLELRTTGMEYASEMVVQATLNGFKISEVPIILYPDGRNRPPHLRSWRDGWRHLKFLLMHAPNWLFYAPGFLFLALGVLGMGVLAIAAPVTLGRIALDLNSLAYFVAFAITGVNIISFGVITKVFAIQSGFIPVAKNNRYILIHANSGSILGGSLMFVGLVGAIGMFIFWGHRNFGELNAHETLRVILPSLFMFLSGIQIMLTSFLVDIIRIRVKEK
jgi:glycosyltransferase involved in cell wall biosynthesis